MTREEASTLFRENDKDKDGFISLEEYFGKERYHADTERERERDTRKKTLTFITTPLRAAFSPSPAPLRPRADHHDLRQHSE